MKSQRSHLLALLLSCSAHIGLGFAIGIGGVGGGDVRPAQTANTITVHLRTPAVLHPDKALSHRAEQDESSDMEPLTKSENPLSVAPQVFEENPFFPIKAQLESHYFLQSELTQKPTLLHDASADSLLAMPGVPSQTLILRLLINEQGNIDQVIVEASYLPQQAESVLIEAFSRIKFYPGKIGATAVKSQMKIEVQLESTT